MKKIGLLGGLGPEATLDYYRELINAFKDDNLPLNYPEIIIYSVNMSEFLKLMRNKEYEKLTGYILEKFNSMRKAGADFAAMTANTPHLLFDRLKEKSSLPLISIVETTCEETLRLRLKKPGLFGTGFTMSGSFYQEVFKRNGITIVLPDKDDMNTINEKLFTEIELGIFRNETRELLINIIRKMIRNNHIDSLILGCTEFPIILPEKEYGGIPMLNTTKLHVDAIAAYCKRKD